MFIEQELAMYSAQKNLCCNKKKKKKVMALLGQHFISPGQEFLF